MFAGTIRDSRVNFFRCGAHSAPDAQWVRRLFHGVQCGLLLQPQRPPTEATGDKRMFEVIFS